MSTQHGLDEKNKVDKLLRTLYVFNIAEVQRDDRSMSTLEDLATWPLAVSFAMVFLLVIWDPVYDKYRTWKLRRAFRLRDKTDR
jgi:hypothetical protein